MKIIKSSFLGARCVRAHDPNIQLFQIRNILNMHRDALVDRILTDLPTYIEYKFHYRASRREMAVIFDGLRQLKLRDIDMEFYSPILKSLKRKDELKLGNEYFFLELDEFIRSKLSHQLNFAA